MPKILDEKFPENFFTYRGVLNINEKIAQKISLSIRPPLCTPERGGCNEGSRGEGYGGCLGSPPYVPLPYSKVSSSPFILIAVVLDNLNMVNLLDFKSRLRLFLANVSGRELTIG